MSAHNKDLQIPEECLLVKTRVFGLITDPSVRGLQMLFSNPVLVQCAVKYLCWLP